MAHWFSKNLTIKSTIKTILFLVFLIIFFIIVLVGDFFFIPLSYNGVDKELELFVTNKHNLKKVLTNLATNKIKINKYSFILIAKLLQKSNSIKAGIYSVDPTDTKYKLLKKLNSGDVKIVKFSIKDGETVSDLIHNIRVSNYFSHTLTDQELLSKYHSLEGLLLADTYHIPIKTKDVDFLNNAHTKFNDSAQKIWQKHCAGLPFNTFYEAVILASIIEKESSIPEEKPLIAGVYSNRLKLGMRLQADPTIIYGLYNSYHNSKITKKDLHTVTAYNTYLKTGLPPTPIAMINLDSLQAAVCPDERQGYLYFVVAQKGHKFSRTLAEHELAVKAYLQTLQAGCNQTALQ